jgi:hypothetical protein
MSKPPPLSSVISTLRHVSGLFIRHSIFLHDNVSCLLTTYKGIIPLLSFHFRQMNGSRTFLCAVPCHILALRVPFLRALAAHSRAESAVIRHKLKGFVQRPEDQAQLLPDAVACIGALPSQAIV